jgi:hypothetical protein
MLTDERKSPPSAPFFAPPPPPPPPAFVPPPPSLPGAAPHHSYDTRKSTMAIFADQDPDIQRILKNNNEEEARTEAFRHYIKTLKEERIFLNKEIDMLNERRRLNEDMDRTLDTSIRDINKIQVATEAELMIFNKFQAENNQNFKREELEEVKESFAQKQQFFAEELKEAQQKKEAFIEKNKKIDVELSLKAKEKLVLNKKISAVEEILKTAVKNGSSEPLRPTKTFKVKHVRDEHEAKLCTMAKNFIYVDARNFFYTPQQILTLKIKLGLFKIKPDLHTSPDKELEKILSQALQMGLNDTALGPTPRKKLSEYLGFDVVEEYERRERLKRQEEDERKRLAREAEQAAAEQRKQAREKEQEAEKIAEEARRQAEAKTKLIEKKSEIAVTPTRSAKRSHPEAFKEEKAEHTSTPSTSKRTTLENPKTPGQATPIRVRALKQELSVEKKAKKLAEEAVVTAHQRAEAERKKREVAEAAVTAHQCAEVERKKREAAEAAAAAQLRIETERKKREAAEAVIQEERVKRARVEGTAASQKKLPPPTPAVAIQPPPPQKTARQRMAGRM